MDERHNAMQPSSARTLATSHGHPVSDNQSQGTVGSRGRVTLENYHFLEVEPPCAADILNAVGRTLEQNVSAGQIDDVQGQLPEELRSICSRSPSPAAR
jgi:hypothetical protein